MSVAIRVRLPHPHRHPSVASSGRRARLSFTERRPGTVALVMLLVLLVTGWLLGSAMGAAAVEMFAHLRLTTP